MPLNTFALLNALRQGPQDSNAIRAAESMRSGLAPATMGGIATALRNAGGLLTGATSGLGLMGLGMTATGTRPSGVFGDIADQIFGGNIRSVPGRKPFDPDLIEAVRRGAMAKGTAIAEQERREMRRSGQRFASSMAHIDAGRHGRTGRDRSAGRGGMGGGLGANTNSGRDKPGPGGKVR